MGATSKRFHACDDLLKRTLKWNPCSAGLPFAPPKEFSSAFECSVVLRGVPTHETRMDKPTLHWDRIPCTGPQTKTGREKADVLANGDIGMLSRRIRSS
jgi:hypothetical protein